MALPHPAQPSTPKRHRLSLSSRLTLCCWCALACLLSGVALVGCAPSLPSAPSNATPSARGAQLSAAWAAVLKQIGPNGEVSLATALQAYTLGFGPLPGVPATAPDSGVIPSGTLAVNMIASHFDELTPAQQQAVLQRLGDTAPASAAEVSPAGAGPTRDGDGDGDARTPLTAAVLVQVQSQRRAPPTAPPPTPTPTPPNGGSPATAPYLAMLNEFIPQLNTLLKVTLTLPIVLDFDLNTHYVAYSVGLDAQGKLQGVPVLCRIRLGPAMTTAQLDNQRLVVAHELTHCYQDQIQGLLSIHYASPDWLIEGSATWTGAVVSGATAATTWLQPKWADWLLHPDKELFSQAYEAIGFYSLLDQAGISPWSVLPAMYLSQTLGTVPDNLAAYHAATQSAPQTVLDAWASSYERNPPLGPDWDLKGPGIVAASTYGGPPIQDMNLGNGPTPVISTPAFTASDYDLTAQADVIQVTISGTSRLIDSSNTERVTSANGSYCTRNGGCACPPGSAYQGPEPPQLTGLVHLAVTGGEQGANGVVSGLTLQQFCTKQKPTAVPPITAAFCQQLLTVDEANAIMQPPTPATSIRVNNSPAGGSCNYEYAQFKSVVSVLFLPYAGPQTPQAEQNGLATLASQISSVQGATVTTTVVSGVGDAALFVTATVDSPPLKQAYLDVIYGGVVLSCFNPNVGSASFTAQQTALTQACQRVVTVLDP